MNRFKKKNLYAEINLILYTKKIVYKVTKEIPGILTVDTKDFLVS